MKHLNFTYYRMYVRNRIKLQDFQPILNYIIKTKILMMTKRVQF